MIRSSFAFLLAAALAAPASAQITYNIVSYHGVSHASRQASFNNLQPQGYRLISLAVAGGYANAHYSAVWHQVAGPAWVSSHGMTESQYSTQRLAWLLAGYRPKIVTASGSGSDVVFAAVFVNDGVSTASPINQSLSTFESDAASKRSAGYRLVSYAAHLQVQLDNAAQATNELWQAHLGGRMPRAASWALKGLAERDPYVAAMALPEDAPVAFTAGGDGVLVGRADGRLPWPRAWGSRCSLRQASAPASRGSTACRSRVPC